MKISSLEPTWPSKNNQALGGGHVHVQPWAVGIGNPEQMRMGLMLRVYYWRQQLPLVPDRVSVAK